MLIIQRSCNTIGLAIFVFPGVASADNRFCVIDKAMNKKKRLVYIQCCINSQYLKWQGISVIDDVTWQVSAAHRNTAFEILKYLISTWRRSVDYEQGTIHRPAPYTKQISQHLTKQASDTANLWVHDQTKLLCRLFVLQNQSIWEVRTIQICGTLVNLQYFKSFQIVQTNRCKQWTILIQLTEKNC